METYRTNCLRVVISNDRYRELLACEELLKRLMSAGLMNLPIYDQVYDDTNFDDFEAKLLEQYP